MAQNEPVVIVDDLHVDYKVYAAGSRVGDDQGGILHTQVGRKGIRTVHALRGVTLVARKNESIGIIGVNGSGKTTLMRALAGFLSPTSGTVYSSSQPSMLGVGAALMPQLSGAWNVVLGCLANGLSREQTNQEFHKIVEFSGLGEFIDLPMRTYSSGMSARLRFSIAAARSQEILIVDEALAVGDQRFRNKSEARIREIREAAGTVFLVSHSMGSIRGTCSRVIWINDGLVEMDGPTAEVTKAYEATIKARPKAAPSVFPLGTTEPKPKKTPTPAEPISSKATPTTPRPKPASTTTRPKPASTTPRPKPETPITSPTRAATPSNTTPATPTPPPTRAEPLPPTTPPTPPPPPTRAEAPAIPTSPQTPPEPLQPTTPPTPPPPPTRAETTPMPLPEPARDGHSEVIPTSPAPPPVPDLPEVPPTGEQPSESGYPPPTGQTTANRDLVDGSQDPNSSPAEISSPILMPRRAV